jgi:hypothetical protein
LYKCSFSNILSSFDALNDFNVPSVFKQNTLPFKDVFVEFTALIGGKLTNIHPSAIVKDILVENSQWFSPDHGQIGHYMKDVFSNYKIWKAKARKQGDYSRANFSFDKMTEKLGVILDKNLPVIPKKVELKLPSFKKNKIKLPKLSKI